MKRLTTNKEVSGMNMYELAHNSCYAKDGKARYRDFEDDFGARELAIKLLEKYAEITNEFTCYDDFDEFMMDALQYGADSILGLIAVFYRNLWAMADLREVLKEYEDLEEQGKLLKLPCVVGDTVYYADNEYYFTVLPVKVDEISIMESNAILYKCLLYDGNGDVETQFDFDKDDFGKTVFLTREEAEDKLAEMEGKNGYTD